MLTNQNKPMHHHGAGGTAFPSEECHWEGDPAYDRPARYFQPGMSLRDYFAAHALTGIIARKLGITPENEEGMADQAYAFADEMLRRRKR